jgi:L-rhamnose mutarotase
MIRKNREGHRVYRTSPPAPAVLDEGVRGPEFSPRAGKIVEFGPKARLLGGRSGLKSPAIARCLMRRGLAPGHQRDPSRSSHYSHPIFAGVTSMIRRAFTMRLKPDSLADYKRHHDNIWPELAAEIERAGIASITTFQRGLELFLVSEIADEAAWDRLWNSDVHKRWAVVMEPLLHLRDDGIVDAAVLTEVFHITTNGDDDTSAVAREIEELARELVEPMAASAGDAVASDASSNGREPVAEPAVAAPSSIEPSLKPPAKGGKKMTPRRGKKAPVKKMIGKKAPGKKAPAKKKSPAKRGQRKAAKKSKTPSAATAAKKASRKPAAKKSAPKKAGRPGKKKIAGKKRR